MSENQPQRTSDDDSPKVKYPGAVLCAHCHQMLALHATANYADGPFVGARVDVCPTSVFSTTTKGV